MADAADVRVESTLLLLLEPTLKTLDRLYESPRNAYRNVSEREIPANPGVYMIWHADGKPLYAGKAGESGLRFRLWKNHLAYAGSDNFFRYVGEDLRSPGTTATREWIKSNCTIQWLTIEDARERLFVEDLAIATFRPKYNRQ